LSTELFTDIEKDAAKILTNFYEVSFRNITNEIASNLRLAGSNDRETINKTNKLRFFGGGGLLDSIQDANSPDNIFKIDLKKGMEFGTSLIYAPVQEFGAKIKISKKMRGFFFAKYKDSVDNKNPNSLWLNMAITKKTHITIKPRPYFEKGINDYYKNDFESDVEEFFIDPLLKKLSE